MKKCFLFILIAASFIACKQTTTKEVTFDVSTALSTPAKPENLKEASFDELFNPIKETEISESVFKLVGSDFTVITAGTASDYNSMVASWGGFGILFNKPTTWCFLRANRFTLEYMKKEKVYTMAYFGEAYKEQIMIFGTKSGRNSDKMKEHTLTPVQTPSGSMSYKEAKLIIECKLSEVTSVTPGDFYTQEGKDFVTDAYKEAKEYHKLVFGEITGVWAQK